VPAAAPVPIAAPDAPPENEFGYEVPIAGCFAGDVYGLPEGTKRLPQEYEGLEHLTTLYACEWNITARYFAKGFPHLADRFEWFAIRYRGTFRVDQTGKYAFRALSDDGSRLQIDGQTVVDNDGAHPAVSRTGDVMLAEGEHSLTLEYFQGPRHHLALQLFTTPPGASERIFTARPGK
jgi:hypothetical protein